MICVFSMHALTQMSVRFVCMYGLAEPLILISSVSHYVSLLLHGLAVSS